MELSKLISECGAEFDTLFREEDGTWVAEGIVHEDKDGVMWNHHSYGMFKTPEGAVKSLLASIRSEKV